MSSHNHLNRLSLLCSLVLHNVECNLKALTLHTAGKLLEMLSNCFTQRLNFFWYSKTISCISFSAVKSWDMRYLSLLFHLLDWYLNSCSIRVLFSNNDAFSFFSNARQQWGPKVCSCCTSSNPHPFWQTSPIMASQLFTKSLSMLHVALCYSLLGPYRLWSNILPLVWP